MAESSRECMNARVVRKAVFEILIPSRRERSNEANSRPSRLLLFGNVYPVVRSSLNSPDSGKLRLRIRFASYRAIDSGQMIMRGSRIRPHLDYLLKLYDRWQISLLTFQKHAEMKMCVHICRVTTRGAMIEHFRFL